MPYLAGEATVLIVNKESRPPPSEGKHNYSSISAFVLSSPCFSMHSCMEMLDPRAPPFKLYPTAIAPLSCSLLPVPRYDYYFAAPFVYSPQLFHNFFIYPSFPPPQPPPLSNNLISPPTSTPATVTRYKQKGSIKPGGKKRRAWICREEIEKHVVKPSLEIDVASDTKADQRTTVMIRNIPNKLSRDMMLDLLDENCAKENQKARSSGNQHSAYDLIYLPIDFKSGCNLGYAFVNFTSAAAVRRLYRALHGLRWTAFGSKKVAHVCYARIQGREALVENFKYFRCDADEYFPAVLSPPRDGSSSFPTPVPVGNLNCRCRRAERRKSVK